MNNDYKLTRRHTTPQQLANWVRIGHGEEGAKAILIANVTPDNVDDPVYRIVQSGASPTLSSHYGATVAHMSPVATPEYETAHQGVLITSTAGVYEIVHIVNGQPGHSSPTTDWNAARHAIATAWSTYVVSGAGCAYWMDLSHTAQAIAAGTTQHVYYTCSGTRPQLTGGEIFGIIFGSVVGVVLFALLLWWVGQQFGWWDRVGTKFLDAYAQ